MRATTFDQSLSSTPVPRRVLAIAATAGTAVVFDGYDLQALSYTLPKLVAQWHISSVQAGLLASYTFVGLFVGAVGLGAVGDRWGRKRMLVAGVVVFALCMGTAGFADRTPSSRSSGSARASAWAVCCREPSPSSASSRPRCSAGG